MDARIWVVIVNYRTAELVIDCLHSIARQLDEHTTVKVAVVDNASGDGSVQKLISAVDTQGWSNWVTVLAQSCNGGFAYGNNAGINEAMQQDCAVDYVMLLNPDTIIHPGAIKELANFLDSHPRAGIVGSQIENANGTVEPSAHNAPSPLGELESGACLSFLSKLLKRYAVTPPPQTTPHACDWVSGASMMIRRTLLDAIGRMDEKFFLYFEEVDFCTRARNAHWEIWFTPASRIVHLEGSSTGIGNLQKRRPAYWYESRRRYFKKHHGVAGLIGSDMLWALGRLTLTIRRALGFGTGGGKNYPKWFAFDLLWGDVKAVLTGHIWRI